MSPNYGSVMLSSPLGASSQISPGQRPMQPPFSPHGPLSTGNSSIGYNSTPQTGLINNSNFVGGGNGPPSSRLSPHGNMSPFNATQVSPRTIGQPSQGFQQQQHGSQLSPQANLGARSSPGVSLQSQPSPGVSGIGPWNSLPNRTNLQPQQQQQQQQQLVTFGTPGVRGYSPATRPSMRSLPSPGPPLGNGQTVQNGSGIRQSYGNGMADVRSTSPLSNGMFNRQQTQQQQQQLQQMRLQRTVSAPGGAIPSESQ